MLLSVHRVKTIEMGGDLQNTDIRGDSAEVRGCYINVNTHVQHI